MPTPRIGLTSYREVAEWGVWQQSADLLPATYAEAVRRVGGAPLLLPPGGAEAEAHAVVAGLDGLLLAGGSDIDPLRYGAERDPHTGPPRGDRDGTELTLLAAALAAGLPVLGVCRGMQVLNVYFGGTLIQHLPDVVGSEVHCPTVGAHGEHSVRMADQGRVAAAMGARADVATYHHQGIERLGEGLVAVGWADDGTIEAVEVAGEPWVVGVQWHPEVSGAGELFEHFIAACSRELAAEGSR